MSHRAHSRVRVLGCLLGGCTTLALLPGAWWSFSRHESTAVAAESSAPTPVTEVETVSPRRTTLMRSQVVPGTIEAFEQADLYAKTSGYVSEVRVDIGDRVKAGQVLAVIDSPELDKELQEAIAQAAAQEAALGAADAKVKQAEKLLDVARAQFTRAKADLELRRLTLTRREELFEGKAITRQELDETRTQFEVAQADAGIAEARIAAAEADVIGAQAGRVLAGAQRDVAMAHVERVASLAGYTRIVAPYDGLVTRRLVNRGDLVQAATTSRTSPLLSVQLVNTVRVVLHVPEAEAAFARTGARAVVTPYVGNRTPIEGKVSRTAGALDASARTVRVEVDLPNPDARLLHGTYVHVKLELEARPDLLVVPASALMTEGKERFVYVVRDERAVRVPVKTGLEDGGSIEITAGLNEGDELVADGRAVRASNVPVRPRSANRG